MSVVVLRCPNCGTVQDAPGECEACHEAGVRYYCANHTPGRWLDAPGCPACGARIDFDPVGVAPRAPAAPPAGSGRTRRDPPLPPASAPPPSRRPRVDRVEPFEPPAPRPERRPAPRPAPRDPWSDAPPVEEPDFPPRRTRRGRAVTPGDLFGPDGPFGPRGPFGTAGPFGRRGRVPDAPGDVGGFPPVRLPTVRVPGIFGCFGRILMLIVFLILAALAGSFVWITQF